MQVQMHTNRKVRPAQRKYSFRVFSIIGFSFSYFWLVDIRLTATGQQPINFDGTWNVNNKINDNNYI